MHDYFEVLGLSGDAPASEVRRAHARRTGRAHPDFSGLGVPGINASAVLPPAADTLCADTSIDFADMAGFVDRIQSAFFSC